MIITFKVVGLFIQVLRCLPDLCCHANRVAVSENETATCLCKNNTDYLFGSKQFQ